MSSVIVVTAGLCSQWGGGPPRSPSHVAKRDHQWHSGAGWWGAVSGSTLIHLRLSRCRCYHGGLLWAFLCHSASNTVQTQAECSNACCRDSGGVTLGNVLSGLKSFLSPCGLALEDTPLIWEGGLTLATAQPREAELTGSRINSPVVRTSQVFCSGAGENTRSDLNRWRLTRNRIKWDACRRLMQWPALPNRISGIICG